ncbi:hypothetical protein PILCRDRAFT_663304 [Piloderma croceum F 1598]|uniref:Uncharacterized protein n=1 Tax=Piloderma croceum (strain F 1598) TaxID=765440 RepID=A0A0C3F7N4_PILCF|nr:hypothetical protein PILCRDRAFT_663304 [Piloderma croceum F 1598]
MESERYGFGYRSAATLHNAALYVLHAWSFLPRHAFPILQQKRQIHRHLGLDSCLLFVIVSFYMLYPWIFTIHILPFSPFHSFLPIWPHLSMIFCPTGHSPYALTMFLFRSTIIYQSHVFFPFLYFILAFSNFHDTSLHINYEVRQYIHRSICDTAYVLFFPCLIYLSSSPSGMRTRMTTLVKETAAVTMVRYKSTNTLGTMSYNNNSSDLN